MLLWKVKVLQKRIQKQSNCNVINFRYLLFLCHTEYFLFVKFLDQESCLAHFGKPCMIYMFGCGVLKFCIMIIDEKVDHSNYCRLYFNVCFCIIIFSEVLPSQKSPNLLNFQVRKRNVKSQGRKTGKRKTMRKKRRKTKILRQSSNLKKERKVNILMMDQFFQVFCVINVFH